MVVEALDVLVLAYSADWTLFIVYFDTYKYFHQSLLISAWPILAAFLIIISRESDMK